MTLARTKRAQVMGFAVGDVAYFSETMPTGTRVQYQLRIEDIVRNIAVCRPVMKRHSETILGRDTGVWCGWAPCPQTKTKTIHLKDLSKKPS
jgi:hypothetical protein